MHCFQGESEVVSVDNMVIAFIVCADSVLSNYLESYEDFLTTLGFLNPFVNSLHFFLPEEHPQVLVICIHQMLTKNQTFQPTKCFW